MGRITKPWNIPQMWKDGEVWIIGGGSSIPRQFGISEEVISGVNSGELPMTTYSDYMHQIHSANVIGVNVAFKLGAWVSALVFCDASFWRGHYEDVLNFKNLKITDVGSLDSKTRHLSKNVKRLDRIYASRGLSTRPDQLYWNYNSGAAAINVATLAGAKRIYLLGFDCNHNPEGRSHWHQGQINYAAPIRLSAYARMMEKFPLIAEDAKRLGVEIINVNPESAIADFPKLELKEII